MHGERARRDGEARADPERAVGLGIERQRVGRCPAQEPHQAAAAQADAAVEGRRLGQARDHAPQLRPAAAGQAHLQLLDLEAVLRAGEREAQIADRVAADIALIDGDERARAALSRQQVAHGDGERHDAVEGSGRLAQARHAVEVEPARRQAHLHGQRVAPGGLHVAGDELRPSPLLEGERQLGKSGAGRTGIELGLQVEGRLSRVGLGLDAGLGLRALRGPRASLPRSVPKAGDRQTRRELAADARLAHGIRQAPVERIGRSRFRAAQDGLEAHGAVGLGARGGDAQLAHRAALAERAAEAIGAVERRRRQLAVDRLEAGALGAVGAVQRQYAVGDLDRRQRHVGRQVGGAAEDLAEALPVPAVLVVERHPQYGALQLDLVGLHHAAEDRRDRKA